MKNKIKKMLAIVITTLLIFNNMVYNYESKAINKNNTFLSANTVATPLEQQKIITDKITVSGQSNVYSFSIDDNFARKYGIQIVLDNIPSNLDLRIKITNTTTNVSTTVNNSGKGGREEYRSGIGKVFGGDYIVTVSDVNGNYNLTDSYRLAYGLDYLYIGCLTLPVKNFTVINSSRFSTTKTVSFDAYLPNYISSEYINKEAEIQEFVLLASVYTNEITSYSNIIGTIKFEDGITYKDIKPRESYYLDRNWHQPLKQTIRISAQIFDISPSGNVQITLSLRFLVRYKNYIL